MRENIEEYNAAIFEGKECKVYNCDAEEMVKKIEWVDVVYMDPPYPSTMNNYDAFYGLFDEMFDKKKSHTDFTQKTIFLYNMDKLISKLCGKTNYVVLSQNTRVQPGPDEIENMLQSPKNILIRRMKKYEKESNEYFIMLTYGCLFTCCLW
jgi:adenine-specific DNA-methyltransferase